MGKHSSRSYLAPTGALAVILACGVTGVAVGPLFVRPSVQFETSAPHPASGGGQVGAVEQVAPVAPALTRGSRPVAAPSSATTGRDRSNEPLTFPPAPLPVPEAFPPATEPPPSPEAAPTTRATTTPPPSPQSDPGSDDTTGHHRHHHHAERHGCGERQDSE
jgi:hypothetical protein